MSKNPAAVALGTLGGAAKTAEKSAASAANGRKVQKFAVYDDFNHSPKSYHRTLETAERACHEANRRLTKSGYDAIYVVRRVVDGECVQLSRSDMDTLDEIRTWRQENASRQK